MNDVRRKADEALSLASVALVKAGSGGGGGGTDSYNDLKNLPTFNGTEIKGAMTATVTPSGSVSTEMGEGTTTTVNSITDVGTLPSYSIDGEKLIVTLGTLPTKGSDTSVLTAVGEITATFTGSSSDLVLA